MNLLVTHSIWYILIVYYVKITQTCPLLCLPQLILPPTTNAAIQVLQWSAVQSCFFSKKARCGFQPWWFQFSKNPTMSNFFPSRLTLLSLQIGISLKQDHWTSFPTQLLSSSVKKTGLINYHWWLFRKLKRIWFLPNRQIFKEGRNSCKNGKFY